MKLPVNKTTAEQGLIRAGWKNRVFSKRYPEKNKAFPRGVWMSPTGTGPHSLTAAVYLSTAPEPTGEAFATSETLGDLRRQEWQEKLAERRAEREAIKADRAAATAARAAERALW